MTQSYDGPTLRAVRESMGVPLRRVARVCGMSHGHLSKVERGEHGRPVTPAVVAAYERVTGVSLAEAAASAPGQREDTHQSGRWRPGTLTDLRRSAFNATLGALAVGGQLGDPVTRVVDVAGRPTVPAPLRDADIEQIETLAGQLTAFDLRHGGGTAGQLGKLLLRWAVPLLDRVDLTEHTHRRLHRAVAVLAARAIWATFDAGAHEQARALLRLGVHAAVRADDADLRAHLLADAAAQHNHLGYHQDALALVRLVEGDERISAPVRMVLHGVKARAYAALGDTTGCRRQLDETERAHHAAHDHDHGDSWLGRIARPGQFHATTGHALAELARTTGEPGAVRDARHRLTEAVAALDPATHTRARALCQSRLATLDLADGEWHPGTHHARQAVAAAGLLTSARLRQALVAVRAAASEHHDHEPAVRELVADLDTAIGREPEQ